MYLKLYNKLENNNFNDGLTMPLKNIKQQMKENYFHLKKSQDPHLLANFQK